MRITQSDLNQFTGSEHYFRHWLVRQLVYTEGVHFLAREAGACWLIDAIASYQRDHRIRNNPSLRDMQFWKLTVTDGKAVLSCVEDSDIPPAIVQEIEHTDFPLPEIDLWVNRGSVDGVNKAWVLMLPSER